MNLPKPPIRPGSFRRKGGESRKRKIDRKLTQTEVWSYCRNAFDETCILWGWHGYLLYDGAQQVSFPSALHRSNRFFHLCRPMGDGNFFTTILLVRKMKKPHMRAGPLNYFQLRPPLPFPSFAKTINLGPILTAPTLYSSKFSVGESKKYLGAPNVDHEIRDLNSTVRIHKSLRGGLSALMSHSVYRRVLGEFYIPSFCN